MYVPNLFIHSQKSDENQMTCCNSCEHYCVNVHASWTICLHDSVSHLMYVMKESSKVLFPILLQIMEKKNYFKCFRLFLDTWKKLDDSLKWKYYEALLEYWLNWIKPTDPIIDALLTSAMYSIDQTDEIMMKKSEAMKWNQNAVKSFEKLSKQWKTDKNKAEQKQTDKNIWRNKKNIEEYKKNIEDNNIILSDDTEAKASEYWNSEINQCLNLIKQYNWWLLDWTVKNNRRYSKLLIDKLNKLESIQEWKFTRIETLEIILKVISQNKYHASKITSAEWIYRNLAVLMQQCKSDISKAQTNQIVLPTI